MTDFTRRAMLGAVGSGPGWWLLSGTANATTECIPADGSVSAQKIVAGGLPETSITNLPSDLAARIQSRQTQAGSTAGGIPLRVFTLTPAPTGKAPFTMEIGGASFNGVEDPVIYFGYNCASGGNRVNTSEPRISLQFEGDYADGEVRTCEAYIEFQDVTGAFVTRPMMFQFRRTPGSVNATLRQSIFRGHPIQFQLPDQNTVIGQIDEGSFIVNGTAGTPSVNLTVNAAAGGVPQLLLQQNGTPVFSLISSNRNTANVLVDGRTILQLSSFSSYQQVGVGGGVGNGIVRVNARSMTAGGLYGFQSQFPVTPPSSWNHQSWENGGVIQSRVDRNGYFMTRKSVPPADTDIGVSELAFWLDDTPGAAKVMFKARDSAGTVSSGVVALT